VKVADLDRLPAPYPGELWYSIVARDLTRAGYSQRDLRPRMALGGLSARINIAYPNRVHRLLAHLRGRTELDEVGFARQHTLLPYMLAFDPASRLGDLLQTSAAEDRPLSKSLGGLRCASTPAQLRYCRTCRHEDGRTFGEPYWHTAHQLPMVANCYLHGDRLFDSLVPYEPQRHDFWTANDLLCSGNRLTLPVPGVHLSHCIAREMGKFNLHTTRAATSLHLDIEQYATVLKRVGFQGRQGQVATGHLAGEMAAFTARYGVAPQLLGVRHWWRGLYTQLSLRVRPLHHVTMRLFLRERLWRAAPTDTHARSWDERLMGTIS